MGIWNVNETSRRCNIMKEGKNDYDLVFIDPVKDLPQLATIAYHNKHAIAVMGPPGCGKTEALRAVYSNLAKEMGKNFVFNPKFEDWLDEKNFCLLTLIGSQIQEIDAVGIPHIRGVVGYGDITEFTPTELFPQEGIAAEGVIFLDEVGNAQEPVKNALQNYLTGGGKISSNIRWAAATNSMEDNSGVGHTGMAFRNRFQWYQTEYPELEAWLKLMEKIGKAIDIKISAYLLSIGRKNYITYDPEKDQYAYSTNRSLEKASQSIEKLDKKDYDLLHKVVGGHLGNSWATDWIEFLQLSDKVDMEHLMKHPKEIKKHETNIGTFYSICVSLVEIANKNSTKINTVLDVVVEMSRDDFGLLVLGGIIKKIGAMEFARNHLVKRKDFTEIKNRFMPLLNTINV
jgi:hypothetical protein